jgi:alpha-tubulin suppressor-like RCC1 family protein
MKISGEMHKLVLFSDGTVSGWGDMRDGQLGPRASVPNYRGHTTTVVRIPLPGKAVDIAAGERASFILLDSGAVLSCGFNMEGELGREVERPDARDSETPLPISGLQNVAALASLRKNTFAIHRDGTVSAWGPRAGGFIADGVRDGRATTPLLVPGVSGVVQLSVGYMHVLALTSAGRVLSWGSNQSNMLLGRPLDPDLNWGPPGEVPELRDVAAVSATGVSAVLKKDGTVWVWGNNGQAQFGNGRRDERQVSAVPVRVAGVANAVALAGGGLGRHFLVLLKDGSLRAWGNSDWGQVGIGLAGQEQASVVTVSKLTGVKRVFACGNNSFAVRSDNSVWFWGGSTYTAGPVFPSNTNTKVPMPLSLP